ncbi:MAG TPA: ferredoxin [Candidatus Dormibacteraeota bacterium]|jgi:ferredoxin|nr:ferredoxin [Candidatus Dormibacteraeota bacterium]
MKVSVDRKKCLGYATCVIEAPDVFEMDDDENVSYVILENPPEEMRPRLDRAVHLCPTRAIAIED